MNYWSTYEDPTARWLMRIELQSVQDLERLYALAAHILTVGQREVVYEVQETLEPYAFRGESQDYLQHLKTTVADSGVVELFPLGYVAQTLAGAVTTPARLAYYRSVGSIVQQSVSNLGLLQQELQAAGLSPEDNPCTQVSPLEVSTYEVVLLEELRKEAQVVELSISLYTDIWFPRLIVFEEEEEEENQLRNNPLAALHSPRLNNFIQAVRKKLSNWAGNGNWKKLKAWPVITCPFVQIRAFCWKIDPDPTPYWLPRASVAKSLRNIPIPPSDSRGGAIVARLILGRLQLSGEA